MPEVPAYDFAGAKGDPVALPDGWFAERVSEGALWQTVRAYEANQRQGTSATLGRSQVAGSGAKPWRQKGTGRARAGTRSSPLWTGGGVVFGPQPRDHRQKVPKGLRRLALRSALRLKLDEEALFVVRLERFDKPSTARLTRALAAITPSRHVLLLTARYDENLFLSGRNLERLEMKQLKDVTAYEVLRADTVLIDAEAPDAAALPGLRQRAAEETDGGEPAAAATAAEEG